MSLKNEKIIWIDIESTGLSIWKDKIVSISLLYEDKIKTLYCNPGIPIPKEASNIHHIYDKDVESLPSFEIYAEAIWKLIVKVGIVGGYNIRKYDIPLLQTELLRYGYELPANIIIIDAYETAQELFKSLKLSDIYRTICNKELKGAHQSKNDIIATFELYNNLNRFYK